MNFCPVAPAPQSSQSTHLCHPKSAIALHRPPNHEPVPRLEYVQCHLLPGEQGAHHYSSSSEGGERLGYVCRGRVPSLRQRLGEGKQQGGGQVASLVMPRREAKSELSDGIFSVIYSAAERQGGKLINAAEAATRGEGGLARAVRLKCSTHHTHRTMGSGGCRRPRRPPRGHRLRRPPQLLSRQPPLPCALHTCRRNRGWVGFRASFLPSRQPPRLCVPHTCRRWSKGLRGG